MLYVVLYHDGSGVARARFVLRNMVGRRRGVRRDGFRSVTLDRVVTGVAWYAARGMTKHIERNHSAFGGRMVP